MAYNVEVMKRVEAEEREEMAANLIRVNIPVNVVRRMARTMWKTLDAQWDWYDGSCPYRSSAAQTAEVGMDMLTDGLFDGPYCNISKNGVYVDSVAAKAFRAICSADYLEYAWEDQISPECYLIGNTPRIPKEVTDFIIDLLNTQATVINYEARDMYYDAWFDYHANRDVLAKDAAAVLSWLKDHGRI